MSRRGELGGDGLSWSAWSEDLSVEKWRITKERPTWLAEQSRAAADESSSHLKDKGTYQKEVETRDVMAWTNTQHTEKQALLHI